MGRSWGLWAFGHWSKVVQTFVAPHDCALECWIVADLRKQMARRKKDFFPRYSAEDALRPVADMQKRIYCARRPFSPQDLQDGESGCRANAKSVACQVRSTLLAR